MFHCREEFSDSKVVDKKCFIRIGCLWGLQAGGRATLHPENLEGYSFIIKGKGTGGKDLLCLFWVDIMFFIISSFSKFSRGVFLSLRGQARSTNYWFSCVQRAYPKDQWFTELTGQDVGLKPPLFYCFEACPVLQVHGFVAKRACLVLCLSKSVFSKNH